MGMESASAATAAAAAASTSGKSGSTSTSSSSSSSGAGGGGGGGPSGGGVGRSDAAAGSSTLSGKDASELHEIRNLLWGPNIRMDVFQRWSQGFEFSDVEPSALVQKQGGPCAVLAPVQAYLLKILIMDTPGHCFKDLTADKCKRLLIHALCNILRKCSSTGYRLVTLPLEPCSEAKESGVGHHMACRSSPSPPSPSGAAVTMRAMNYAPSSPEAASSAAGISAALNSRASVSPPPLTASPPTADTAVAMRLGGAHHIETSGCSTEVPPHEYHARLHVINFDTIEEVEKYYTEHFVVLSAPYGVLLFMYTVLLTKGIENVISELSDASEPLIHNTYGYGSQGLINLMLTGRAVAHVWDNDQDVGGLKLPGINEQSDIGFITLMEQMRYCTVGSFFKNPRNPVWVMGSETHLTVLFSNEKRLVSPETPSEIARRVFKSYDPDGNNFIPTAVLQDVLAALDLVSEPEYVEIMQKRLDPEGLGIILLNAFMDEFFPLEKRSMPDTFDLMHYNGIPGSNEANKVRYYKGTAILLESDLKSVCVSNPMMTCLQTKWPNIEINWHDIRIPSLN